MHEQRQNTVNSIREIIGRNITMKSPADKEIDLSRILHPQQNCSCLSPADKVSFLIDTDAYFRAFRSAAIQAEKSIYIEAWDIYSRERLLPEDADDGYSVVLGDFLNQLAREKKDLRVYILLWDFAMLVGMKREWFPIYRLGWKTHRHINIEVDGIHAIGASHHQKIVIVDDRVVFVGGIDMTRKRWDTPAHHPVDPRREKIDGVQYRPNHDVQMVAAGEVAAVLGDLFRKRWKRVTHQQLNAPSNFRGACPWPRNVSAGIINTCRVGVARTRGRYKDISEIREVEQLYLDTIASAEKCIYIENQYFTAQKITNALVERLEEEGGPEIVIVLPLKTDGWLSQYTMDRLRTLAFNRLYKADRFNRLRFYYPYRKELDDDTSIKVHSKLMIADTSFVRIGSANLNNRSMGLDSECDLAVASEDKKNIEEKISALRSSLLAEHLDTQPEVVDRAIREKKSLIRAIESLICGNRTLQPLQIDELSDATVHLMKQQNILDPENPIDPEEIIEKFMQEDSGKNRRLHVAGITAALLVITGAALLWKTMPVQQFLSRAALSSFMETVQASEYAYIYIGAIYVAGGLIVAPITLLLGLTFIFFGPWQGLAYAFWGVCCNATATYWLGYFAGRSTIRRLAGRRLNDLSRRMGRRGILSTSIIRLIPVAPFTVVNMVAGVSHIRFLDFLAGTLLGMLPGILAFAGLVDRGLELFESPDFTTIMSFFAILLAIAGLFLLVRKMVGKETELLQK